MSGEPSSLTWLPVLGSLALKSLFLFLVAGGALLALRRASASARHLVCLLTLAGLLALPLLSLALPGWRLAVLASAAASPAPAPLPPVAATMPAPAGIGEPTKVVPFAPPSARLSPLLVLPPPAPAPRPFPWLTALSVLWLGGALVAGLRPLLGLWGIARLSQGSAAVSDASILALATECASSLGLTRTPALRQADAPVPMTWGWRRPVVLLPADAAWPPDRLRAVLLHELAHVRRRDWLSHRFADLVCALYWFHPLVWLVARRLRAEGEIACDDLVLTSGVAAPDYARHLLDVARALRPAPAAVPQAAIAMARTARIEGRLKMILDTTRPHRALTRRALLLALGLGTAALVPLAALRPAARAQAAAPALASLPAAWATANGTSVTLLNRGDHSSFVLHAARFSMLVGRPDEKPTLISSNDLTINGTTLLAGVTDARKPGSPWWNASGKPLPTPVYDTAAQRAEMQDAGGNATNVTFAFRLPAALPGATVSYDLPQSSGYSSDGSWPLKTQGRDHVTEAQLNGATNGVRVVTANYPATATEANIRIGLAAGPWKRAAGTAPGRYVGSSVTNSDGTFIFSPMTPEKGNIWGVTITTGQPKQDLRIVAVDAQGHELLPCTIGDTTAGGLDQITARFADLPLPQIKEFRVETRPFQWVEFKNVALRPAH